MKKVIIMILGIGFLTSCSPKYVNFTAQSPEEISTNQLKSFLHENKTPKLVLRAPNINKDKTSMSSSQNEGFYSTIEKEF
jgi:hypothetical protein